jgi:hypothetical protein
MPVRPIHHRRHAKAPGPPNIAVFGRQHRLHMAQKTAHGKTPGPGYVDEP